MLVEERDHRVEQAVEPAAGVRRDGEKRRPLAEAAAAGPGQGSSQGAGQGSALAGVQVQTLTADIANQLGLPPGTTGVVVTSIDPNSPAADALQRGVVIQEVNHRKVANITEYDQAVQAAGTKPVLLLVNMRGQTGYVVISPSGQ